MGTKDDNGYNQAFADAATAIKGMPDSNVVEAESIKETEDCEQTMSTMVEAEQREDRLRDVIRVFPPHAEGGREVSEHVFHSRRWTPR